jgi:arginyl-tRNA synthetase
VNDAGRQMDILATSVYLRYVETDKKTSQLLKLFRHVPKVVIASTNQINTVKACAKTSRGTRCTTLDNILVMTKIIEI